MGGEAVTRLSHWLAILAALLVMGTLNACVAPATKTIAFQGDSIPVKTSMIVTIDMAFTKGTTSGGTIYPVEYAPVAPFIHFQVAQIGTVLSYSLKVFPVEPKQVVTCLISINGLIVDRTSATYPKPAVCSGPPV